MWKTRVQSLGWEDPLEKEMATYSSTLAWKIPWTEQRDRLQFMGLQRVGHDRATSLTHSHWVFAATRGLSLAVVSSGYSLVVTLRLLFVAPSPGADSGTHGLSSCGTWVWLLHGMWDLSSQTRDRTHVPCIGRWIVNLWTTRDIPKS